MRSAMDEGGLGTITYRKHPSAWFVLPGLCFRSWSRLGVRRIRPMRRSLLIALGLLVGLRCPCLRLAKTNRPSFLGVRRLRSYCLRTPRVSKLLSNTADEVRLYRSETGTRVRTAEKGGRARNGRCQDPPERLCLGRSRTELLGCRGATFVSCRALRWSEPDLNKPSVVLGCICGTRCTGHRWVPRVCHCVAYTRNSRCRNCTSKSTGSLRYLVGFMMNRERCPSM